MLGLRRLAGERVPTDSFSVLAEESLIHFSFSW